MVYELTASAAQMCTPVPAAAAGGWVDWVDHWQTLGGNIVGGVMGIAGALVVATRVNGREQWIAAGMVRPDLHQLVTRATELEASLPRTQRQNAGSVFAELKSWAADGQRIGHAVQKLRELRPALFALHTPVVGQLSDIDARLYGHLFQCQCQMAHKRFEAAMTALVADPQNPPPIGQLYEDWQRCGEHARLAGYFLDKLVFARGPRWLHRLRMRLIPNARDAESRRLLLGAAPGSALQSVALATGESA
ncbi:hypothetical protein [Paraburkholderia caledonica]|uniref:hypothetical protein n=1 Tax=Paraburkholderia caledonica TaxID=134536 RepID=UPI000378B209|nr:hypothetical protein [Paraburkholderia caledonica]